MVGHDHPVSATIDPMKQGPIARFLIRWFVCSLGLWIAAALLASRISYGGQLVTIAVGGLVLAIMNTILKPLVVILSLPAILFSLGFFMIIINGLMVFLASKLYHGIEVSSFGAAMLAGAIIGLVNYLVSVILDSKNDNL